MDSELLTTGEVAKLCGVTPDAVLKWIKKGKLPATQTAGGHYRTSRREVVNAGLLDESCAALTTEEKGGEESAIPGTAMRCWEYFGRMGAPPEKCNECFVYRAKVEKCYEAAELGDAVGHQRRFCRPDCRDCPFYRACQGLSVNVLFVTKDQKLVRKLSARAEEEGVSLCVASCGYECSTMIETHRPAVIVMDSDLQEVREGELPRAVLHDDRVPGMRILIARRKHVRLKAEAKTLPAITQPFSLEQISSLTKTLMHPAPVSLRNGA